MQPAIKCRGREYLRIIYGPEYLLPENLSRLRSRLFRRNGRWRYANLLLASKHWNDSFGRSRFAAFMNAFSVSWPSKASPSIRVFRLGQRRVGVAEDAHQFGGGVRQSRASRATR